MSVQSQCVASASQTRVAPIQNRPPRVWDGTASSQYIAVGPRTSISVQFHNAYLSNYSRNTRTTNRNKLKSATRVWEAEASIGDAVTGPLVFSLSLLSQSTVSLFWYEKHTWHIIYKVFQKPFLGL